VTEPELLGSRLELRRRRRRQRLRLVVVLVVLLAVSAAAFAVWLAADAPPRPQAAAAEGRTQSTLLLQVQAEDRTAVASALLAADPDDRTGAVLLVPQQVLVNVPGIGSLPFSRGLTSAPPQGSRDALSDLMGVTVDEGWVLPSARLVQLVDLLGGIPVEVDVPVVADSTVLLDVGPQRVDGAGAVQLLQYLAPEEQEQSRMARLQEVLDGVLTSLPAERAELVALLEGLGPESDSTLTPPELADRLLAVTAADGEGQLQYDNLPVLPIDTGVGVTAFRVDPPKLLSVVDRLLADSVPAGVREGGNRVLVLNGVGTPGWARRCAPGWRRPASCSSARATRRTSATRPRRCSCRGPPPRRRRSVRGSPRRSGSRRRVSSCRTSAPWRTSWCWSEPTSRPEPGRRRHVGWPVTAHRREKSPCPPPSAPSSWGWRPHRPPPTSSPATSCCST
jgi:hypothetical protein